MLNKEAAAEFNPNTGEALKTHGRQSQNGYYYFLYTNLVTIIKLLNHRRMLEDFKPTMVQHSTVV